MFTVTHAPLALTAILQLQPVLPLRIVITPTRSAIVIPDLVQFDSGCTNYGPSLPIAALTREIVALMCTDLKNKPKL